MQNDPIVEKRVGKKLLKMRESHMLPFYMENNPFYDRALPYICEEISKLEGTLKVVDIGANIGDSVALITDRVKGSFLCIEGDPDFLPILKENVKKFKDIKVEIEESFCAARDERESSVTIDRSNGTAKIVQGGEKEKDVSSLKKLDTIIKEHLIFGKANVLKIDTDGYELNVLRGGQNLLRHAKPTIYFEFTPILYEQKGQNPLDIFELLKKCGYEKALIYDNFGRPMGIVNTKDVKRLKELIARIDNQNIYYYDVLTFHSTKDERYRTFFANLLIEHSILSNQQIGKEKVLETNIEVPSNDVNLEELKIEINRLNDHLNAIYATRSWKLLQRAKQSEILKKLWKLFASSVRFTLLTAKEIRNILGIYKRKFLRLLTPKTKRIINKGSKKVVVIDHSYHTKTKSSNILIDYLKKHYEVEVVFDGSWKGEKYPDLDFIDNSYLAVFFWQTIPSRETLDNIKNDNLIFCPMYDSYGLMDISFWNNYDNLKIINFSKVLHNKLKRWGFNSIYLQYFPKPPKFNPGEKNTAFFWQRMTEINIHTVVKLLGNQHIKLHIHKAVDPTHEFIQPSKVQEGNFDIKYSDWFENRSDMDKVMSSKAIYISPRIYEGIGLSFLEAMAKGKAVIAQNSPTMNEYIKNNKNGYLYDLSNPTTIDFSHIDKIQKNAYKYMQNGYKRWELNKRKIIQFIKQP